MKLGFPVSSELYSSFVHQNPTLSTKFSDRLRIGLLSAPYYAGLSMHDLIQAAKGCIEKHSEKCNFLSVETKFSFGSGWNHCTTFPCLAACLANCDP